MMQQLEPGPVLDAGIISAAQRAEHYEIGGYGTCAAWGRLLGLDNVVSLLEQTLEEEKATDKKLTALAEQEVNLNAANLGREEGMEEAGTTRRQSSSATRARARAADRRRR